MREERRDLTCRQVPTSTMPTNNRTKRQTSLKQNFGSDEAGRRKTGPEDSGGNGEWPERGGALPIPGRALLALEGGLQTRRSADDGLGRRRPLVPVSGLE